MNTTTQKLRQNWQHDTVVAALDEIYSSKFFVVLSILCRALIFMSDCKSCVVLQISCRVSNIALIFVLCCSFLCCAAKFSLIFVLGCSFSCCAANCALNIRDNIEQIVL